MVMIAGINFALKIATKQLQIETYGYYCHRPIQRYHRRDYLQGTPFSHSTARLA